MQAAVSRALQDRSGADPLCEEESHQSLEPYMREAGMPHPEVERTMRLLTSHENVRVVQEAPELPAASEAMDQEELELVQETSDHDVESATKDRKDHQFKEEENGSVGDLSTVCSQIVLKCLFLARIGRPDFFGL